MIPKKAALGRGLGALIADNTYDHKPQEITPASNISEIELDLIVANPYQPRTQFDEEALDELANSIRELGIIQPVTVRKMSESSYQLISGERRLRASKIAGLKQIPAYIREADDQAMLEFALVENIQRENLNAIEVAISYQRLIDECSLTQENLSQRVGKKRATVANYLRLLKLPAEIQIGLRDNLVTMGHARTLISIESQVQQLKLYHQIIDEQLSVRKAEELSRLLNMPVAQKDKLKVKDIPMHYLDYTSTLKKNFGANVELKPTEEGKGKIVFAFQSEDELERLMHIFNKLNNND